MFEAKELKIELLEHDWISTLSQVGKSTYKQFQVRFNSLTLRILTSLKY